MKLFIAICPIIMMMAEITSAASVGHFKRDENDVLVVFQNMKESMDKFKPMVMAVMADLPSADAYHKYKLELENFVEKYNEKKREMCLVKVFYIAGDTVELMASYEADDAPAEAQEVMRLFYNHGYKEFAEKQGQFLRNVDVETVMENIDNLDARYMNKYKEFIKGC